MNPPVDIRSPLLRPDDHVIDMEDIPPYVMDQILPDYDQDESPPVYSLNERVSLLESMSPECFFRCVKVSSKASCVLLLIPATVFLTEHFLKV